MGLSGSKTKTTNTPWGPAQPYILKGMEQSQRVFDQQQPSLDKYSGMQMDTYGKVAPGAEQGIMGAQGVVNSTLAGDNLNGNPYLQKALDLTRADVTNSVNGQFEGAGRYGSGMHAGILAKQIADAENQARFQNYAMERANQVNAVGQASNLMAGSQSLLNNAAELPWIGVGALNGNIRQASNGYGTQTTKTSPNYGEMLLNAAAQAAGAAASDRRLKENIVDLDNGLYEWTYRHDLGVELPEGRFRGVMADEVPSWMLGPPINGYATVYYTPEKVG
jgi:hypothetical protein